MFQNTILLILFFALHGGLFAQGGTSNPMAHSYPVSRLEKTLTTFPAHNTPDWRPQLRNTRQIPSPRISTQKALYQERKAEANRLKRETPPLPASSFRTSSATAPTYYQGFPGNVRDVGNPNDNDIAVSPAGYKVSVVNLDISAYGPDNQLLFSKSLEGFTPGIGNNQKFDPRIVYDYLNDRFVFVCLNGFNPTSSRVVVAFSSSGDPLDPWYAYGLPGNFDLLSGTEVWSDFPQIGLSEEELFISVNLFDSEGEGQGTGVYQIELANGYTGDSLIYRPHSLQGTFSITPVLGAPEPYGENMFFLDNVGEGGDRRIFLHEMSGPISENGRFKPVVNLVSNLTYALAPMADQRDSEIRLMTGDCRVHSAYMIGKRIYFAFNARERARAGIYFGCIKLSPVITFSTASGILIGSNRFEYGYPRIAYGGCSSADGEHSTLMVVDVCSMDTFPGSAVLQIDTLGQVSEPTICNFGSNFLGRVNPDSAWRWGDYTGIGSPAPGEIWVSGYSVSESNRNQTFISRLFNGDCTNVPLPLEPPVFPVTRVVISPNPATDIIHFDFQVATTGDFRARIYDLQGRLVYQLIEESLKAGEARVSFAPSPLGSGVYILAVESEGKRLLAEKFVVNE